MITEIRTYLSGIVLEVDSELTEHQQYFTSENIADTRLENTFFIQFGDLTTARQDTNMTATIAVSITIWKNGYKEVLATLDHAYENAVEITAKAMAQSRIDQTEFIKAVEGTTITPAAVGENNNLASYTISFEVTAGYKSF